MDKYYWLNMKKSLFKDYQKSRSSFLGYFFRVFSSGFISSSIHNNIRIHVFPPHWIKGFWYNLTIYVSTHFFSPLNKGYFGIFPAPLFWKLGSTKTGTGEKNLVSCKDWGEGYMRRERFSWRKRPARTPWGDISRSQTNFCRSILLK